ncbi:MAG TPA: hypothetical protein DCY42_13660 [Chloroflexi bacterium]|nr:hypothetical protein [Chloroflexota bacterium]
MKTNNLLTLPDGRKLAYAEFGKPDGYPVLYFHAAPSSRLEPLSIGDESFCQLGLRVICPDRPGIGQSDFQPQRGFSDWPKDVEFLANTIELKKFSVLGVSGGSGYAAACAAKIPERLHSAVIASGAWRINSETLRNIGFPMSLQWQLAIYAPILLSVMLRMMIKLMSQPPKGGNEQDSAPSNKILPAADHAVITPAYIAVTQQVMKEVMKQGSKGPVWDMRLYVREWDFDPAEIQIPLTMFHGEQDRNVPVGLVQRMATKLPHAKLITYPDEAHVSTYINRFGEIAKALIPA